MLLQQIQELLVQIIGCSTRINGKTNMGTPVLIMREEKSGAQGMEVSDPKASMHKKSAVSVKEVPNRRSLIISSSTRSFMVP